MLTRLGDHAVCLGFCIGQQAVGLGTGMAEHAVGLGVGTRDHRFGVLLGLAQQRVAGIEHVLCVVEFTGNGVLDVVDEFEHIPARDDAAGGHRHTARFFDDRAELVERFKNSVHGNILQA